MKRVYFYKVRVCYTGYIYDLASAQFRDYLITAANRLKNDSYSTHVEYLTDEDAHNVDGHFNFYREIDGDQIAAVSWAEIDKNFSLEQVRNDLKTEINYHKLYGGAGGVQSFEYLLEFLNQVNM